MGSQQALQDHPMEISIRWGLMVTVPLGAYEVYQVSNPYQLVKGTLQFGSQIIILWIVILITKEVQLQPNVDSETCFKVLVAVYILHNILMNIFSRLMIVFKRASLFGASTGVMAYVYNEFIANVNEPMAKGFEGIQL